MSINEYFKRNTIRIKITGKCNMSCPFCHEEGGMSTISEIKPTREFLEILESFCNVHTIKDVVLTGGEPLCNLELVELIKSIKKIEIVESIRLVTNALLPKSSDFWNELKKSGLDYVTISCYNTNLFDKYDNSIKNQMDNAKSIIKAGIFLKFNIVAYCNVTILNQVYTYIMRELPNIDIVLLNDVNNFQLSAKIINEFLKINDFKEVEEIVRENTSNKMTKYVSKKGYHIFAKKHELFKHPQFCKGCKQDCREGFYGYRLEKKFNQYYLRLCIDREDDDVYIKLVSRIKG